MIRLRVPGALKYRDLAVRAVGAACRRRRGRPQMQHHDDAGKPGRRQMTAIVAGRQQRPLHVRTERDPHRLRAAKCTCLWRIVTSRSDRPDIPSLPQTACLTP